MRWEVRPDWSNRNFFPGVDPNRRVPNQTTAQLGLLWWFRGKQGAW